jgi:hypothetical protein
MTSEKSTKTLVEILRESSPLLSLFAVAFTGAIAAIFILERDSFTGTSKNYEDLEKSYYELKTDINAVEERYSRLQDETKSTIDTIQYKLLNDVAETKASLKFAQKKADETAQQARNTEAKLVEIQRNVQLGDSVLSEINQLGERVDQLKIALANDEEFRQKVSAGVTDVPGNAILMVDGDCPAGWKEFTPIAGRVAVGSGSGKDLTSREKGQTGGQESHTLSSEEIPSHSHSYTDHYVGHNPKNRYEGLKGAEWFGSGNPGFGRLNESTSRTGGNQPHNIMQPYLVLNFCVQE